MKKSDTEQRRQIWSARKPHGLGHPAVGQMKHAVTSNAPGAARTFLLEADETDDPILIKELEHLDRTERIVASVIRVCVLLSVVLIIAVTLMP
ncbi:hypothetical protein LR948_18515 [Roseivivax sp. GX 12232]|uniref:hypothetical protein n=1 Tax=Roseivivax sp. GX 12232 TaxID=2900547 RepID=UPI001E3A07E2|nr:hypothetical protein [Roseivivax sp. GX 12232]MCE0507355.1 hypothetical protein [Roseivivax sp. GX 12232]